MRYYLYISDAKVDMLLPQVPGTVQQKISAKFGFDIKLLSGSLTSERSTLDNRIARLQAVEEFVLNNNQLGSPSQPESWISGCADAKVIDTDAGAVLFVIKGDKWLFGLGGSTHHLIGSRCTESLKIGFSFMPSLISSLLKVAEQPFFFSHLDDEQMQFYVSSAREQGFRAWMNALEWAYMNCKFPPQRIEFLAKRLATGTNFRNEIVTLATPLYVAAVD